ncbi:MAG: GDP-mannose 4,6-dehydratase [Bacteroidales bacterium]|nr:GDP-mannose 4,6-dehydratase [Bacteroidales bacterium]
MDGALLAELLLSKGYEVHGIIRRSSSFNTQRIDHIFDKLHLHYGDLSDPLSLDMIMEKVKPQEVYHLGAQSHVKVSFEVPYYTGQVDALGTLNILEAMRKHCRDAKLYNACTSEMFGDVLEIPQKETTPFNPTSPYGTAKVYSFFVAKNYRESYNMFICNGILFNHECESRGHTFVTKKCVVGLVKYLKTGEPFYLGNVYAKRDWGFAPEFVNAMYLILQQDEPDDYVVCTGENHTIKEFIDECILNINEYDNDYVNKNRFRWKLDDKNREILWDDLNDKLVIGIDEKYYRPNEVNLLLGDYTKAKEKLGWEPKVKFKELVKIMMTNELKNSNLW